MGDTIMNLPQFDYAQARWDEWREKHIEPHHQFVQFETGELVFTYSFPSPESRRKYTSIGVQVVSTADDDCPKLYIPGEAKPLTKASLARTGMQYLLIDLDTKRAVRLGHGDWQNAIPKRFNGRVTAYFSGNGRPPQGAPINVSTPYVPTDAERQHIEDIKSACEVWVGLNPPPSKYTMYPQYPLAQVLAMSFASLPELTRRGIAQHAMPPKYKVTAYPYLNIM